MIKKTLFSMFAVSLITAFTAQADLINFTGTVYHDSGNLINASNAASGTNIGTFTGSTVNFSINSPDGSGTPMSSFFTGVTDSSTLKNSYWWNRVMSDPDNQFGHGVYSTGVVIDGTASFHAGDTVTITHDDGAILSLQGLGIVINSGAPTSNVDSSYMFLQNFTGTFDLKYEATNGNPEHLDFSTTPAAVPEPSTITLFGAGLLAVGGLFRKKSRIQ
jgi:hypothetical protein